MEKKEKLQMLRKLSEKDLTKRFLIPLYESPGMDCKNVRYAHRRLEFGKDIVYCKEDEYGNTLYIGIQVKKTRINTKNIDTIFRQTHEAFGEPFTDLSDGKKKDLDRFVVLTSNEFSEEAKGSFWASLKGANLHRSVTCLDGNQVVGLLDKHLPSAFWKEYDYFNRYFNAMKADFTTIKDISAIGQKEPVPLEQIYVSLKLSEEVTELRVPPEERRKLFGDGLPELEEERAERPAERARVLDGDRAVQDYDRLVIVGVPGSGKTTLLKYLALKTCRQNLESQERTCVPIPITLRYFADSGKSLRAYADTVFEKYQFPKAKEFVEKDLKAGKCRLLLDGFDELATKESQKKVAGQIKRFGKKYGKTQIVATSRPAGYHDELTGFTRLELMDFDDKQIKQFIDNWFGRRDPERAKLMLGAVMENEQIKRLAKNPLMIAIIAIIYEEDRKLPQRRADLYQRCVEVLLSKWDVQKRLKNRYPSDKKEFILKKLAFYGHTNNKRVLTEEEVTAETLKHFPQVGLKERDAKPFLDEIWQRSYLLRQISMTSYDFLHLSFQEYFTALELKAREDGLSIIMRHLAEPWWEEPILLYAGISKDASGLIKRIRKEVPEDIFCSNLMLCGKCIADAEFTEPALKDQIINELWSIYQTADFDPLREKAIQVLGLIKPDSLIQPLIADLNDEQEDVRRRAADALGRIASDKAIEPLLKALATEKNNDDRAHAADALGLIGSEKVIEGLFKALATDKDSFVRWRAADALGRIGGEKAIEPLLKALATDENSTVRWRAADALGTIASEKAIEPLLKALATDKDSHVQVNAADALGCIGSEKAIEPLLKAMATDTHRYVRGHAADALGRIASDNAIEPLLKALATETDSYVRVTVASALATIGSDKPIEPLLKAMAPDKDGYVRARAAYALGSIASDKAIERLLKALATDKDSFVRVNAADALGSIASNKAIEALLKALATDKDSEVRGSAADALGRIASEKAIEPLKAALKDEGEYYGEKVKDAAFAALEKISKRLKKRIASDKD